MPDTAPTPQQARNGVLLLLATATLWSLNGPLIKLLNQQGAGVSGLTIACYRSLLGGLVLLPFAWRRRETLQTISWHWPVASVLMFTLMTVCFVIATTRTAASSAIILQETAPLWVFLLSPVLLGERPHWREGVSLLLAMVGVAIIFWGHRATEMPALLIALTSGVGYGGLIVTLRGLRRVDSILVTSLNLLGSGLLLTLAVPIWSTFCVTGAQLLLLLAMSLVQLSLPYLLFSLALRSVEAHRASLIVLLEPLLNPIWTYLAVGEAVPRATLIGGPFILAGVVGWMLLGRQRSS
jgi:drug/metabolite transporter (DMT)-like permease